MMKRIAFILITTTLLAVFLSPTLAQQTGTLTPISPIGTISYGNKPAMSGDGRFIAFMGGDNTIAGDTNYYHDVFVYDRELDTISLVSRSYIGNQAMGGSSLYPSISKNGRYISYESEAYNLVQENYNGYRQIYVYDQQTGKSSLVSINSSGALGNRNSFASAISGDGRYVAFTSEATNLVPNDTNNSRDVFVHDRQTGQTTIVSVTSAGQLRNGNAETVVDISADGRYVAFISSAQLADVPGLQIYVHDRQAIQTERITRRYTNGGAPNGMTASYTNTVSISDDGRYVAFMSDGSNLVPNDYNTGSDGFIYDRQSAETSLIAPYTMYNEAAYVYELTINGNAEYAVFSSQRQFVPEDTNDYTTDVFRYHIPTQTMALISVKANGEQGIDNSYNPVVSDDGRWVAFLSPADNFVTGNFDKTHLLLKAATLPNPVPTAPTLLTPTTSTSSTDPQMTFTWDSVANATDYQVQLATDAQFTKIQYDQTVATTNTTIPIIYNAYYWRVRGKNGAIFGDWSEARTFSRTFTSTPVLNLPADVTTTNQQSITFTWGAMTDVLTYEFELASDSGFTSIISQGIITSPTITRTIGTQGTYYWHVRGKNGEYVSDWSNPFNLTITQLPAPVLLTPAQFGLITTQDPIEFSWESVPNATHYQIYISQDPTFEFVWYSDEFLLGTTYTQYISQSGTYYWKVIAYQDDLGGVVSSLNQFNVDFLPTPISIAPNANATVYSNMVTFTWEPVVGATGYYIHIDFDSNPHSSPIYYATNPTYTHTFPAQGTFYWRVTAYSDTAVSDESETRAITIATLATPNLTAPVHQSTTTNNVITFTWDAVDGAPEYEIQINSNASGYQPTIIQTVTTNSYTFTAIEGATYSWRVRAKGAGFNISSWSATRQVTLDTSALPVVTTLISPVNQSTITNWNVTFSWQPVDGVTEYEFHLSNSNYYGNSLLTQVTTNTSITFTIPQNLTYYWRVRTKVGDVRGAWTNAAFNMDLYNKPVNLHPLHNAVLEVPTNTDVTFTWDAVAHVTGYQIQISTDRTFSNTSVDTLITSNTYTHNLHSTEWYWRVRGRDGLRIGYWSDVQRVTVAFLPTPTLTVPVNNTTILITNTAHRTQTYQWNAVAGATSYTFQFASNPEFSSVIHTMNRTTTSYTYETPYIGTLYWRIRANKTGGSGAWSQPFTIIFNAVPPPTLISPDGNAVTTNQVTFTWNPVPGATLYYLEAYSLPYNSVRSWTTTNTSYTGSLVANPGNHAWRVRSEAAGIQGSWSEPKQFSLAPLPAPTLITPVDRDFEDITPTRTLSWNPVAGATAYILQLKANSSSFFSTDDINMELNTSYNATGLSPVNYYYWRVIPMSGAIRGTPSETRVFRVKPLFTPYVNTPVNMAIITDNNVTFDWVSVPDATGYQFQVGTSIEFSTLLHDINLSGTTQILNLADGNTYFWRVRATHTNGALSEWSYGRQFTVNPLPAPNLVTPTDMTSSPTPAKTFTWDSVAEATAYQIQISPSPDFAPTVVDTIIATTNHNHIFTSANTYYWRVRAIKGTSNGYWSGVRQITIEAPAIPNLVTPINGLNTIYPNTTFTWDAVANATSYQIQISTTSNFNTTIQDQTITITSHTYVPMVGTYYWRVRAQVDTLNGDWSDVRVLFIEPMPAPVIIAPLHMTTVYDPAVNFSWEAVTDATEYDLQISTDGAFGTIIHSQTITTTHYDYVLPMSDIYYWRVRGKNSIVTGEWSNGNQLAYPLPGPNLTAPEDMFTTSESEATFTWDTVGSETQYRIQISFDSQFNIIQFNQLVTGTSHTQAFTAPNTYYWRVRVANNGDWSVIRQLTINAPPTPNLTAPVDMATISTRAVTFTWDTIVGATNYRIQISTNNTFTAIVSDQTLTTTMHTDMPTANQTYYWRVQPHINTLIGDWSPIYQFTTQIPPSPAPNLIAPADMDSATSFPHVFSWDVVADVTQYQFQITDNPTFETIIMDYPTTATSQLHTFTGPGTYYWRVRGNYHSINGEWSVVHRFVVNLLPPPTLIAPLGTILTQTAVFSWDALPNATDYQLEVTLNSNFSNTILLRTIVAPLTTYEHTFPAEGVYYWRLRAINSGVAGHWSNGQFTITQPPPIEQTPNEQDLFNATQNNLPDAFQFAIMDVQPEGIMTTLQFDDGAVANVMVNLNVNNGLIIIALSDMVIQGGGTPTQRDILYEDVPLLMIAVLDDLLPEDYVSIESLTLTDTGMNITVIVP